MRKLLADAAFWLSGRAADRAETVRSVRWKIRFLRRSEFWADVECWLAGLDSWRTLRERRRRQRQPRQRTTLDFKPITGRVGPNASY